MWRVEGPIFMARGRKKRIGWVGLSIDCGQMGPRLIGWVYPRRGGLDGRSQLAHTCQKKLPEMKVHLASEDSKRFPGWIGSGDGVVWLEKHLTQRISREELRKEIAIKSKRFFKTAKPLLKKIVEE
jgi:hypothetical protein